MRPPACPSRPVRGAARTLTDTVCAIRLYRFVGYCGTAKAVLVSFLNKLPLPNEAEAAARSGDLRAQVRVPNRPKIRARVAAGAGRDLAAQLVVGAALLYPACVSGGLLLELLTPHLHRLEAPLRAVHKTRDCVACLFLFAPLFALGLRHAPPHACAPPPAHSPRPSAAPRPAA